ncbi:unnamed protein product [Dovyalis caffra]|uniref:Uncharacterized protein n=1 Tax=Dovyalis caffra TaxID=77055 RepID=A0AAV1SB75_9ROSI|nr:unnamed protein product [Dovyalis caffra]
MGRLRRRFLSSLLLSFIFQILQLVISFTPNYHIDDNAQFLTDVLKEISVKQDWDLEGTEISKLEVSKVRIGSSQRHEFKIRVGKSYMLLKFPDEVDSWKKLSKAKTSFDFGDLIKEFGSMAVLDTLKLRGPFDLWVSGHDNLSLLLPMNASHGGLKRILVGEGIAVEVKGAKEVSLFHDFDLSLVMNGSVIIVAYRNWDPDAEIETSVLSKKTIELISDKCYDRNVDKNRATTIHFFSSSIARLERVLSGFIGDRMTQNGLSSFLRATAKASTVIRFQLELEKSFGSNETVRGVLAEWRTRPTVERVWFEVMTRVEGEKLKPVMVKKVRPFIAVDSVSWSNLMSNISFTNFPSVLVPPEALTLDSCDSVMGLNWRGVGVILLWHCPLACTVVRHGKLSSVDCSMLSVGEFLLLCVEEDIVFHREYSTMTVQSSWNKAFKLLTDLLLFVYIGRKAILAAAVEVDQRAN